MANSSPRSIAALLVAAGLAAAGLATAQPAAAVDLTTCLAENAGIENSVCSDTAKLPGTPTNGQVRFTWQATEAAAAKWVSYSGGIWMSRSPIAGQQRGVRVDYPTPDSRTTCLSPNFQGCFATFSGLSGSIVLDFPLSTAGYQYILLAPDKGVDVDGNLAEGDAIDSGITDSVVWVNKAYRYRKNGKAVTARKCPPGKQCTPVVVLELNRNAGGGMPVRP